ncbi:MAG: putative amidohydrolase [Planctomycetota bacterium]|jgi:predicted amidohydrolase
MKLKIASCQFPVGADIKKNESHICRQIRQAAAEGADVVHFCEGALSGYALSDFKSFAGFDWASLKASTIGVMEQAKASGIYLVLGSCHPLSGQLKPHNSVYVISSRGKIVTRYDKRFCASDENGKNVELAHFTPGNHVTTFTVKGVKCGVLICHEYRYPELYREMKKLNVEVVFHSFHAGNLTKARLKMMEKEVGPKNHKWNHGTNYPAITMPAAIQTRAQSNYLWISATNSSAKESTWATFVVRPDGVITERLRRNGAGLILSTIDTELKFYDATKAWRKRAMNGQFHSGKLVQHPRSENLKQL